MPLTSLLNIAHRGASAYAPENTIEAFDLALALGATSLEIDVRQTRDGELVVVHDEAVERTLRGRSGVGDRIADLTWDDLARFDAGTWFNELHPEMSRPEYAGARILRLEEVFERYGNSVLYFIELKHPPCATGMEVEIVDLVRRYGLIDRAEPNVIVGAFSQKCLRKLHDLDPDIGLVQLFHAYATSRAIRAYLAALPSYCTGIGPCLEAVDERLLVAAARHDLRVYAWTVNDRHDMIDMIDLGVAGVVTDFPDLLDDLLTNADRRRDHRSGLTI